MSISWRLPWFETHSKAKVSYNSSQISPEQYILTLKVPAKHEWKTSITHIHIMAVDLLTGNYARVYIQNQLESGQ